MHQTGGFSLICLIFVDLPMVSNHPIMTFTSPSPSHYVFVQPNSNNVWPPTSLTSPTYFRALFEPLLIKGCMAMPPKNKKKKLSFNSEFSNHERTQNLLGFKALCIFIPMPQPYLPIWLGHAKIMKRSLVISKFGPKGVIGEITSSTPHNYVCVCVWL